ncbi:MAG TPA: NAD(P)H-dependent oxidoreductase [Trebonia sp.]|jgi:FMN reductase|nr:NAD(P)H-dependent oxidoreductase [Trebonia sp.]
MTAPTLMPRYRGGDQPLVVGIGGTLRSCSSSETALRCALDAATARGARAQLLTARELVLPMYDSERPDVDAAARLLTAVRAADALILATPGYHGGTSGLLKNALDYLQELAGDPQPYLDGKAVGCIVTAAGWQAGASTLAAVRSVVHALRGWPTPLGVVVNSLNNPFGPAGEILDAKLAGQLDVVGTQVVSFAQAGLARVS